MDDSISRAEAFWRKQDASDDASASDINDRAHRDTVKRNTVKTERIPLGMDSFDAEAHHRFGQSIRIAMACMDGSGSPSSSDHPGNALPSDAEAVARRLQSLGRDIASAMADQLELLVRFDDVEGWRASGSRHCVAWMNLELGISPSLGWEYLRVGRKLRSLPITTALFRAGRLTWSIVRLLSRVADEDNEGGLCHAALDASVSDVERLCNEYRWQQERDAADSAGDGNAGEDGEDGGDGIDGENRRSLQQIQARSFTWHTASNGNTVFRLSLPPELAQAFLLSVEQSLAQLEESTCTMPQRRADAAVLMAETSLDAAGREMACADRYQVIVSVDASELRTPHQSAAESATPPASPPASPTVSKTESTTEPPPTSTIPGRRARIHGAGPIARDTARRIACDCSLSSITLTGGEPTDIGRKSRLWTPAMARAIKNRDQHCQYPGCTQTRHLQIHHIQHWADGGSTCIENGVCLCQKHHSFVHEGGYRIERVDAHEHALDEQFRAQQPTDSTATEIERLLRNSRASFDHVRNLLPTRYRFRVVDARGRDIRDSQYANHSTRVEYPENDSTHVEKPAIDSTHVEHTSTDSTRVEKPAIDSTRVDYPTHDAPGSTGTPHWPGVADSRGQYVYSPEERPPKCTV